MRRSVGEPVLRGTELLGRSSRTLVDDQGARLDLSIVAETDPEAMLLDRQYVLPAEFVGNSIEKSGCRCVSAWLRVRPVGLE